MKAMVLTGLREMEMVDVPDPQIVNDTDVLIRMGAVGVCGSDVHYYETGKIGSQVVQYPYRVGHECAGTVEAVGSGVTRFKPGDRIAVDPAMSCYDCDQCKTGRAHTCRTLKFLGCPGQAEGCLAEKLVMPEASCYLLRDTMTLEQAALSEPMAIGVYAVDLSGIDMNGAKVGVLGAGPIGLSVMLPARAQGAEKIYMTEKIKERCMAAVAGGADWVGNPDMTDIVEDILELEPLGLDVVFECCGQQEALDQALDLLKPGGKLMIIGIPREDRISFSIDQLRRKEICVQNVRRQEGKVQKTLDMMDNGSMSGDFMVTHRFDFDQSKEAFDLVAGYKDGVIKAMIHFEE